jgi:hypothetical protein
MTNNIKHDKATANNEAHRNCRTWTATLQLAPGVLLVTATAYVYTLMQHPAVLIASMMGAALLFQGARAFQVCRQRPLFGEHHHPSAG